MKKNVPILCFFVSLLFDFLQFQKQLMTKLERRLGFKPLGNHYYIKRDLTSNKKKSQKEKRGVTPSLLYLHDYIKAN